MKHLQTKINMDGTICLDYYDSNLYSVDTAETVRNSVAYIERVTGREVRRYPFSVAECDQCGIELVTNRDFGDIIKCQNCGKEFLQVPKMNNTTLALLKNVHKALGYQLHDAVGLTVYMLIIIEKDVDKSILKLVLNKFGFRGEQCSGDLYEKLLHESMNMGWITSESEVAFCSTNLDDKDCLFEGTIPRVEACARLFTRLSSNSIKTISIHVPSTKNGNGNETTRRQFLEQRIAELVKEEKMSEAIKLMDELP